MEAIHTKDIPFTAIKDFTKIFIDYIHQAKDLENYYDLWPTLENFETQIQKRKFSAEKRGLLHKVLENQYQSLSITALEKENIQKILLPNTFTVTTGHQLNIFTGPLYFIYKIATTIKLSQQLQQQYPAYNFVPIYWMATEDHDFEEINHFKFFEKTYTWQTNQTGAVGRFSLEGLEEVLKQIPPQATIFQDAYTKFTNLADATRYIVHQLFGKTGLIVLNPDEKNLKKQLIPIFKEELLENTVYKHVTKTSQELQDLGYHTQVNPREINIFYLEKNLRERIIKEGENYKVLNTNYSFSQAEILEMLEKEPEKFSPNVILRPIYQELILPNLAYIGGPGEIAYWLQLKSVFEHYQNLEISYPILMPRNFILMLDGISTKRFNKLNLLPEELFLEENTLKATWLNKNLEKGIDLNQENQSVRSVFEQILQKFNAVDKSLEGWIKAEEQKASKMLENIEKRLQKAQEKTKEIEINQLLNLKKKLFPDGNLQERVENILGFYTNDPTFLEKIMQMIEPFNFSMQVHFDEI